jgi:nitrous oxidase accessory protein
MKSIYILLFSIILSVNAISARLAVCSSCSLKSISKAVKTAGRGDTIIVKEGVYQESGIIIDHPVTLTGKGLPVINGKNNNDIFIIRSDFVNLSGFKIINSGFSTIKDFAGIRVENSGKCIISDNILEKNYFAIYLSGSRNCTVRNNRINGFAVKETSSGNGIHLWKCNNILIENNRTLNHRDGIYLEFSEQCSIKNNFSQGNLRYGLHFMFSHSSHYISNHFVSNGSGVAVMYSEKVEMSENTFEKNWGPASYGLLLKDISRSEIKKNKFITNTMGIYMEGVNKVDVMENEFTGNGWGVKFMGNCLDNRISRNNFLRNTFDLVTNSFELGKQNYTSENYWDKYTGYDLDKNKIGDVPYRPVSLFSVYVERIPYSIVLLRSFLVDLLDSIERAVPAIIPETLKDEKPMMQKLQL